MKKFAAAIVGLGAVVGVGAIASLGLGGVAYADSQPYELVCPGTPVGTVIINDVVTTASISPASPSSGQTFNVTNYQTKLTLVAQIAKAAVAIQPNIQGTATSTLDVSGATPGSQAAPAVQIDTAIPDQGVNGVPLALPTSPESVGPFTVTGGTITVSQDKTAQLTLEIGGNPLPTTCTAYPNNSNATGLATAGTSISGTPTSPVIATTSAGSGTTSAGGTTATTAAPTATSAPPATAASNSSLPYTGAGPGLSLMGRLGVFLLAGAFVLLLLDGSRRFLRRGLHGARRH